MVNLGIDFGSTYTLVSYMEHGQPKPAQLNSNSYVYPSEVCRRRSDGKYFFGASAKSKNGEPEYVSFKGFKMLLNQQMEKEPLAERNYIGEDTPEKITRLYLRHVIETSLKKLEEDKVDHLVIGAPECWFQSLKTIDARGTLRGICNGFDDIVNHVEIRSEPTNAAAFCVWKYEQENKEPFDGKILVVDYGGGTLDTALVSVTHVNDKICIKPEMLSGIGENENNEIGKAGIAYQEAVVRRTISDALGLPEDQIPVDAPFMGAAKEFETKLIEDSADVDEGFEANALTPEDLDDEIFTIIHYDGKSINVSFGQMKDVYDHTIRDSLRRVLDESVEGFGLDEKPYLALVGGFCNFYLVREQINDYFRLGGVNASVRTLFRREEDREKAISYGTALFSNQVIEICHVANFSIGMWATFNDGSERVFYRYAINFGQEYTPEKVYFATDKWNNIAPMIIEHADKLLLNFSRDEKMGFDAIPKAKFAEKLKKATKDLLWGVFGFSIDAAEVIRVHIFEYTPPKINPKYGAAVREKAVIPLSTFKSSFGNSVIIPKQKTHGSDAR